MHFGGKALFALAPLLAFTMGCSSEEEGKAPPLPLGKPSIVIRSVGDVANPAGSIDVSLGCDGRVPVSVAITNFNLRPPGACFGYPQCGQLGVLLDPKESGDGGASEAAFIETSATTFIEADFGALTTPEGSHLLRVALFRDGTRTIVTTEDGAPLLQDVAVSTKAAEGCDAGLDVHEDAEGEEAGLQDAGAEDAEAEEDASLGDAGNDANVVDDAGHDAGAGDDASIGDDDAGPDASIDDDAGEEDAEADGESWDDASLD